MDAGDATLVVRSELCPRARLITVDDDFWRYRRFRHQPIPLVIPERAWLRENPCPVVRLHINFRNLILAVPRACYR